MRWWAAVELVERILQEGARLADEVEVYLSSGSSIAARLQRREIHYAAGSRHQGLSIRVIHKGCIGASGTQNPDQWRECLGAAVAGAKLATSQPWNGLPDPADLDQVPLNFDPDLRPEPESTRELLLGMIEGTAAYPVEITSGSAEISVYSEILANSHGLNYTSRGSNVSAAIETIREQSTGYEFDNSWKSDLDPLMIGEKAAELASTSTGGKEIATGEYDVVLSPLAFSQLLGAVFIPALSGRNVHAGRSRLANLLGQQVTDPGLSILDDPFHQRGLSATRWDAEGTPTDVLPYVKEGVLQMFAYDIKNGSRYGKKSTGSAVRAGPGGAPSIGTHNIRLEGPRTGVLEGRAIFVHDVVGAHTANPLTGDFSVELSNASVFEGGVREYPIRKAMLSGNVFSMLEEIGGLSRQERVIGSFILPDIRLKNQRIIGNE